MPTTRFLSFFSVALIFSLLLSSCQPREEEPDDDDDTTIEQPQEMSSADHLHHFFMALHPADQRQVFDGLPAEFRFELMKAHLEYEMDNDDDSLHQDYLQKLVNGMKVDFYLDTSEARAGGRDYLTQQLSEALRVYDNDSTRVMEIFAFKGDDSAKRMTATAPGKPDCECNIAHDLCVFGDCKTFDCKKTKSSGCGPGWLYACDGMCQSGGGDEAKENTKSEVRS